jgi:hypothetical protein
MKEINNFFFEYTELFSNTSAWSMQSLVLIERVVVEIEIFL